MDSAAAQPNVFLRNCSCLAALVVLLYDHASTFKFEYKYIWNVLGFTTHIIIMLRVYALHQKDYKIGILLVVPASVTTGIAVIIQETIMFILTFAKRNVDTLHTNIVNKVVRDGGRFYAFMIVLPSVQAIHTAYTTYLFVWRLTVFSILACRLIKGLLQISAEPLMNHSSTSNGDVELTSFVNVE
ncbi:hypothetical protein BDQ17DRAFT_1329316 [Cyathus striatus]|nr:hypothetical protein BDQ17DRAFT_1329316 [Cyathus striatus]